MPNGHVHSVATISATSAFLTYGLASSPHHWAIYTAIGSFAGLICNPDLDVDTGSFSFHILRQTGGNWLAKFWEGYFFVYARLIPHRSFWSHAPLVGTAGRALYTLPLWGLPTLLWSHFFGMPLAQLHAVFIGLAWVDTLHYIMDFLIPKRFFPQNPYRR